MVVVFKRISVEYTKQFPHGYSIYGRKVWFRVIRNDYQNFLCSTTSNFARNFPQKKKTKNKKTKQNKTKKIEELNW